VKNNLFLSCALLLLGVSSVIEARHQRCPQRSLKIVGAVVAYDQVAALVNITDAPQQQVLVVRADKALPEAGQYLKVVYKYGANEASLPDDVFDAKSKWRFSLTRDCGCDGSVGENESKTQNEIALPTWKQTIEGEEIPRNMKLPCYVLRPKGLKPTPEKSHKS
jgi:hypothetical protein